MASRDRPDRRSRHGDKRGEITEKVGLPGLQAAIADDGGVSHSEAEKGELSLPDRAADAAPSSIHIPNGLGRALVDAYKGLTVQLDQLCALAALRREPRESQHFAAGVVVAAAGGGPAYAPWVWPSVRRPVAARARRRSSARLA